MAHLNFSIYQEVGIHKVKRSCQDPWELGIKFNPASLCVFLLVMDSGGAGSGVWGGGSLGKEAGVDFNTAETGDDESNWGQRVTFVL